MSVRVNLLPEATKQRDRAAQQRSIAALAGVVLLAGLGGVYLWQSSQVTQAEEQLVAEQLRSSELRGEQAELVVFQELADRRDRSTEVLQTTMGDEVSVAGILQDVALVMPPDTELETLDVSLAEPEIDGRPTVGTLNITGRTLTAHAPGVERVLLALDKIASLKEPYMNSSTLQETDGRVAVFSIDSQIGQEAETGRYTDGLPKESR
jgi:Tfp pilus assembly protein PilN